MFRARHRSRGSVTTTQGCGCLFLDSRRFRRPVLPFCRSWGGRQIAGTWALGGPSCRSGGGRVDLGAKRMATRAWSRNEWMAATAACLVLGCGARALVEPAGDDEDLPGQGNAGRAGSGGRDDASSVGDPGAVAPPGDADELVEGGPVSCGEPFRRSDEVERACPYIYRGVCYPSGDCACASACLGGAQCVIEGFLEPDEPQRVRCISP